MGYPTYTTPHGDVRLVAEDTTAQGLFLGKTPRHCTTFVTFKGDNYWPQCENCGEITPLKPWSVFGLDALAQARVHRDRGHHVG